MDSETRLKGSQWLREGGTRKDMGAEWRQEVRPAKIDWRNYGVLAYQLDSTRPDEEIRASLDDPTTCAIGYCNDPADPWYKELAFIIDPMTVHDLQVGYSKQATMKIKFATLTIEEVGAPTWWGDEMTLEIGRNNAIFTGGVYTWNTRPAVTSPLTIEFGTMMVTMFPRTVNLSQYDAWSAGLADAKVWPLWYQDTVEKYGYRARILIDVPSGEYVRIQAQITDWEFVCA